MTTDYKIRKATLDDIDMLYNLGTTEDAFRIRNEDKDLSEEEAKARAKSCFWGEDELKGWINHADDNGDVLLIAEKNGKNVGFVLSILYKALEEAELENTYTIKEERGNLVASALRNERDRLLKQNNAKETVILTEKEEVGERAERHGYDFLGTFNWHMDFLEKESVITDSDYNVRSMETADLAAIKTDYTSSHLENLIKEAPEKGHCLLVAEKDGEIKGYAISTLHKPTKKAKMRYIHGTDQDMEVNLLNHCKKNLKENGAGFIAYIADETDEKLKETLAKAGYVPGKLFEQYRGKI